MKLRKHILAVIFWIKTCISFKVSSTGPGPIAADEGASFQLSCSSDNYYEYCAFTSPMGEVCNFEWRRREWNITMKSCDSLSRDITFIGSYEEHECAIEIKNMNYEYLGVWKCQLEQYVFGGSKGSGIRAENRFLVYTPTTTTTTTSTKAPRTGKELDLDELDNIVEEDGDITLNVNLLDQQTNNHRNKVLVKMFSSNIISGGVAFIVMIIFLAIFAYIVYRHRSQVREPDDVEKKNLPNSPNKSGSLRKGDDKPVLTRNLVSSIPDRLATESKSNWGSPTLRNKIPLSPQSMVSTCSSNRSSRRTSLTSIVPSINEEDNQMDKSDIEFMMKIMPHLITMSPEEIVRADFSRQNSGYSITGPVPV